MTDSPSEIESSTEETPAADEAAQFAAAVAEAVGGRGVAEHGTVRVYVDRERWIEAVTTARDRFRMPFFSWLSAIDWSRDVEVGEPVEDPDTLEERFEVIARISSVTDARGVHLVASVPKDDPWIDSLVPVFAGAEWHEREAYEMFGIDFRGHPNLVKLYLPDAFEGHPLLKSYPLLSREVKPWPGKVDVEGLPSTENPEADDAATTDQGEAS